MKIESDIEEIKKEIKLLTFDIQSKEEKKAIAKMKTKPKFFYKYVKKFSKVKQSITQLFDKKGEIQTNSKDLADILQNQFISVFSSPENPDKLIPPETPLPSESSSLSDFTFSVNDLVTAINEVDTNSSSPNYSVPAPVLKNCKNQLAYPLFLMWTESFKGWGPSEFYFFAFLTSKWRYTSILHSNGPWKVLK